ncbi:MAG: hypothetical protein RIE24_24310 [Silicimonas sp.]
MSSPLPRARGSGSAPSEWLDNALWDVHEILSIAEQSPWFPVLVFVASALALLWVTGRMRKKLETSPWASKPEQPRLSAGQSLPVTRTGKDGMTCKWYRDKVKRDGTLQRWQCRTCGVDAFTHDGKPPKECKRGLREAQL